MAVKSISPKNRWIEATSNREPGKVSDSTRWAELTDTPFFKEQLERALLEYFMNQTPSETQPGAMAFRVEGAKGLAYTLLNLGEVTKPLIDAAPSKQLNKV